MPTFAIVDTAGEHDNKRAREVCAGLEEGEVVVFDKAYVDFAHLHGLDVRSVQWVTRAKDNFRYRTVRNLPVKKGGKGGNVPDREAHRLCREGITSDAMDIFHQHSQLLNRFTVARGRS